ncbi:MAG: radical SAM protein [Bacillota bacterium]
MQQIVTELISQTLEKPAFTDVCAVIVIGSAANERFEYGRSDIDLVLITNRGIYQRGSIVLSDEQHTSVDYSIGSADAIIKHYSNGSGRPYGFYFADALIFRDKGYAARKVIDEISDAYLRNKQNTIIVEPAWRLTLTNKCNFGCFFCHGEGLSADVSNSKPDFAKIYDLILRGIDLGCDDFTFTGGEPLIYAEDIARILMKLNRHPHKPQITVVTNAMLVKDEIIQAAKLYGAIKFNVSFHSTTRAVFQEIICKEGNEFETVRANIERLSSAGIAFTLNYVVLRNINDSSEAINEIVEYALQTGASALKFLELLMIDKLIGFYPNYCDVRFVAELLKGRLISQNSLIRRDEYLLSSSNLKIYIQRCRCRLGCVNCIEDMDRIITPDGKYEPCFVKNERIVDLSNDLSRDFAIGDELINQMSERYGEGSPLLVGDPKYTEIRETYFYETDCKYELIDALLVANNWRLERVTEFSEVSYSDNSEYNQKNRLTFKIGQPKDSPGVFKIFAVNYEYKNSANGGVTIARFSEPSGPTTCSLSEAEQHLVRHNLTAALKTQWNLNYYINGDNRMAIGRCEDITATIISSESAPVSDEIKVLLKLSEISQLFPEWLKSKIN